jgi:hypothetical protein
VQRQRQDGRVGSASVHESKSKPLEWWKGERMLYGRVHACKFYSLKPLLKLYVNLRQDGQNQQSFCELVFQYKAEI